MVNLSNNYSFTYLLMRLKEMTCIKPQRHKERYVKLCEPCAPASPAGRSAVKRNL